MNDCDNACAFILIMIPIAGIIVGVSLLYLIIRDFKRLFKLLKEVKKLEARLKELNAIR